MDGKCLCGAITLHTPDKTHIDACHCGMCRRWGGGPALGLACGADVTIEGSDKLKVYQSSEWAERAFCGECGTHMFYRLSAHLFILGGTFVHPWRHNSHNWRFPENSDSGGVGDTAASHRPAINQMHIIDNRPELNHELGLNQLLVLPSIGTLTHEITAPWEALSNIYVMPTPLIC